MIERQERELGRKGEVGPDSDPTWDPPWLWPWLETSSNFLTHPMRQKKMVVLITSTHICLDQKQVLQPQRSVGVARGREPIASISEPLPTGEPRRQGTGSGPMRCNDSAKVTC